MLISNEWLKDYVNVDQPVQDLAEKLHAQVLRLMTLSIIRKI